MNCFVVGNGGWGTALGMVLASNGHSVTLWGPFAEEVDAIRAAGENTVYLPGVELPRPTLSSSSSPHASSATPSKPLNRTFRKMPYSSAPPKGWTKKRISG